MIVVRNETLDGREFTVTTSDSGYMIERDGAKYSEAWDLKGSGRTYIETDIPIDAAPGEESEEVIAAVDEAIGILKGEEKG